MTGNPEEMENLQKLCLDLFDRGETLSATEVASRLLDEPALPMHSPDHHFLVPAALLTAAHMHAGSSRQALEQALKLAFQRAQNVPGGICGQYGCCGAAVGAGLFASVWNGTTPLSKTGWAAANELTARCLAAVASVEGPRCCKRVTYLAVGEAERSAEELLGVSLGEGKKPVCSHFSHNRECRGTACPFFPVKTA